MKSKLLKCQAIIASVLLVSSMGASAGAPLKVAVVKDALGSDNILAGKYTDSIALLSKKDISNLSFEESTSLCVAYLRAKDNLMSEAACTAAVETSKSIKKHTARATYLKSISYSNRGVSRYLSGDIPAAMDDLTTAILLDKNTITESNLASIKVTYSDTMTNDLISKAD